MLVANTLVEIDEPGDPASTAIFTNHNSKQSHEALRKIVLSVIICVLVMTFAIVGFMCQAVDPALGILLSEPWEAATPLQSYWTTIKSSPKIKPLESCSLSHDPITASATSSKSPQSIESVAGANYPPPEQSQQHVHTAEASMLSSAYTDDFFAHLLSVTLTSSTGASLHVNVNGFLREPGATDDLSSVVTLLTRSVYHSIEHH